MHYTTREKVEAIVGTTLNLTDAQWESILEQTDMIVDTYIDRSYIDPTVYTVEKEMYYDVFQELRLRKNNVIMVDSIVCQYRAITGWAEYLVEPTAYRWFADGLILIASPYVNYTPNVFQVSYRYKNLVGDIPRYVKAGAAFMGASIVLAQPKSILTQDTLNELMNLFGGDLDKIKSVSIEGVSVTFDGPSTKSVLDSMTKAMADAAKSYKEQGIELLKRGDFRFRAD